MDMSQALCQAAAKLEGRRRFDARGVFGKRVGKHTVFPVGLGSALAKAVRQGFLVIVNEGSRRRGNTYEFTEASAMLLSTCGGAGASAMPGTSPPVATG